MEGCCVNSKETPDSRTAARPLCLPLLLFLLPLPLHLPTTPRLSPNDDSDGETQRQEERGRGKGGGREYRPAQSVTSWCLFSPISSLPLCNNLPLQKDGSHYSVHYFIYYLLVLVIIIFCYSHSRSVFLLFSSFSSLCSISSAHSYWICNFHSLSFSYSLVVSLSVSEHHCHKSTAVST